MESKDCQRQDDSEKRANPVASKSLAKTLEETFNESKQLSGSGWTDEHECLSKELGALAMKRKLETQDEGTLLVAEKAGTEMLSLVIAFLYCFFLAAASC